jgi:hypothetical protein
MEYGRRKYQKLQQSALFDPGLFFSDASLIFLFMMMSMTSLATELAASLFAAIDDYVRNINSPS